MKIVICSLTYPLRNGVTNSINLSVNSLLNAGHQVKIIAPDYEIKARPEHIAVRSSRLGRLLLQLFGKEERMFNARARSEIEAIIDEFQPDVFWLHTVSWAPNIFEKIMLESSKPSVLTYHTLVEVYGRQYAGEVGATRMIERSKNLANEVDQIIVPSAVIAKRLRDYGVTQPINVIPTGIIKPSRQYAKSEICDRFGFAASSSVLLFVGRISKEKNIAGLLEMAVQLKKMTTSFRLLLVGPGDVDETIDDIKRLGLSRQVIVTGPMSADKTRAMYSAADVFVFASQSETQGLVLGEAMIVGTPVVALDSPIQKEIYPESTAVVVRNNSQFAGAVFALLSDENRRRELGAAGRKFVEENFSISKMAAKQLAVFTALMSSNGGPDAQKSAPQTEKSRS